MTKTKIFVSALFFAMAFSSCSNSSMRVMATWVNKKDIPPPSPGKHKIFIFVMTQNYEAQVNLENDLAAAANAKGIPTVRSIDAFGAILTQDKLPKKEAVISAIKELGCDAIFSVALVDQQSETHYVPATATSVYTPYPGYGYYYGGFYAYSPTFYTEGYYTTDKTYFIESNLYDVATEKLLISMQSKVVNPGDIEKASKRYTNMLVTELQNQGYMK